MRVIDIYNHRMVPTEGDFGIEIEIEGDRVTIPRNQYWNQEADGSLRPKPECCEYVLKKPLSYEGAIKAIDWLNKQHKEAGTVANWSFRCSTHVHLNVQEMLVKDLLILTYLYYIFEEPIVKWAGEERVGNRFCLRLQDSMEIPFTVEEVFSNNLGRINGDAIRYAALNLAAISKYGSIEFRSLNGTTDKERISKWLNAIMSLKTFAEKVKDVEEVFNLAIKDLNELGEEVFGNFFSELYFPNWERAALYNMSCNMNFIELYKKVEKNEKAYFERVQQRQQELELAQKRAEELRRAQEAGLQNQAEEERPANQLGVEGLARALQRAERARR